MLLARSDRRFARRRGAILLIVLTLLALFSVVGLSFALYAESQALGARTRREAVATEDGPPPVELTASAAIGKILYGERFATYGVGDNLLKATRGHEDSTMLYGDNPNGLNIHPYNGVGQFSEVLTLPTPTGTVSIDRRDIINYSLQMLRRSSDGARYNGIDLPQDLRHVVDPSHSGFRNNTQIVTSPGDAVTFPTKAYVARNAPYTYPDRLNVKVAMQDPTTGRILIPSYHRPALFGSLDRSNQNWRDDASNVSVNFNAAGRYKILRPRPYDHRLPPRPGFVGETEAESQFPFPPANPDGTITGDVQNIAQTDGRQQNDAVWVDVGLPPIPWRGRMIQPLVAATILPLDGRVNVNVAGNPSGSSTHGFGPWEIGLGKITSDATAMVNSRTGGSTPSPRGTNVATWAFAQTLSQSYAAVNWDGNTIATPMTFPAGNQSDPTYPPGFDSATASNTEASSHPGLFLPYTWNAFSNPGKLFPHTDLRRSAVKYAGKPNDYLAPYFGATTPATLTATGPEALGRAAARYRAILTTASNSLQRPQLMPNFADIAGVTNLVYDTATGRIVAPAQTLTNPVVVGAANSDFGGALNMRHALAILGGVNLNRPLADYRAAGGTNTPLASTNIGNALQAMNERQAFARDVFARLVLATGAKAIVDGSGNIQLPRPQVPAATPPRYDLLSIGANDTTQQEYDALRHLAQLAVNIVDTIDNDDIATTFVWNPTAPTNLFLPDVTSVTDPMNNAPTALADRVVFGVERQRVVLNEVYSEVTNHTSDIQGMSNAAMQDFQVRFFIELCNPTQESLSNTAALGDGSATIATAGGPSAYQIQIYDSRTDMAQLFDPAHAAYSRNVVGGIGFDPASGTITSPGSKRLDYKIVANAATITLAPSITNPAATQTTNGFKLVVPEVMAAVTKTSANEFLPAVGGNNPFNAAPYATGLIPIPDGGGMNANLYSVARQTANNIAANTMPGLQNHVVVLRRLANPYANVNDPNEPGFNPAIPLNPYITVDTFSDVASRDAIRVGSPDPVNGMRPMGEPTNANTRSSRGRRAPYYGYRGATAADSFTALEGVDMTSNGPDGQRTSFFFHNTSFTIPAQWLPHFDRPLVNAMDLLTVTNCKPHEQLHRFSASTDVTGATPLPFLNTADWIPKPATNVPPTATWATLNTSTAIPPLHRALELLTVKPWGYGIPTEGRVPGKININMIWNRSVLEALLDQNGSNTFTPTDVTDHLYYNQTTPTDSLLFGSGTHARTKDITNFAPGNTVDETGLATDDRPFKSFGTAAFAAGGIVPAGSGLPFTLLRDGATAGTPAILTTNAAAHPLQRAEMLRKMFNSVTTTSDTYLAVMTVGFFEVRNATFPISTTNPLILGKEVHDQSAGDLRGKFVAILDRSMMATDLAGLHVDGYWQTTLSEAPYQPVPMGPYYCRFAAQGATATAIQFAYEGRIVNLPAGGLFGLGAGANYAPLSVTTLGGLNPDASPAAAFNATTGLATVTLGGPPGRTFYPGDPVSNGRHVHPDWQPNFDVNLPRYKGVVPYFERVEIGK